MGSGTRELNPAQRADDARRPGLGRVLRTFADKGQDASVGGRVLLVASGATVLLSSPMLHATPRGWLVLALVSAAMLLVLVVTSLVDWSALPGRATLVFPASVCLALITISTAAPGLVSPLSGLLTLCFAYLGLTQRPGTSIAAVPLAAFTFVDMNGGPTPTIVLRLIIATLIWVVLAELLALFVAQQSELHSALLRAAHVDALTGVANRRDLQTHLTLACPGDAVIICDLDHFKRLNDTRGHHAGDLVLADFGAVLRAELRSNDYCARYGGEEFVLVLPNTSLADTADLLRRLRTSWSVMQPGVTFSAGVANCRADRSTEQTLAAADAALYDAKHAGRNTDRAEPAPKSAA